jgi:hypothetical protein
MKPVKINILDTDIVITNLVVLDDDKTIEIDFEWNGKTSESDIKEAVEKFVIESLERSVQNELVI